MDSRYIATSDTRRVNNGFYTKKEPYRERESQNSKNSYTFEWSDVNDEVVFKIPAERYLYIASLLAYIIFSVLKIVACINHVVDNTTIPMYLGVMDTNSVSKYSTYGLLSTEVNAVLGVVILFLFTYRIIEKIKVSEKQSTMVAISFCISAILGGLLGYVDKFVNLAVIKIDFCIDFLIHILSSPVISIGAWRTVILMALLLVALGKSLYKK